MYSTVFLLISLLAASIPHALACEGECIVQITKAFLGNYSSSIRAVFQDLGEQVSTQLVPPENRPSDPMAFMKPILDEYDQHAYNSLETAIFPSYFHGKCQRFSKDGQDPPGCPNPDCPVVCGTPGSLVHFYSTLRYIAFNSTKNILEGLTTPGSSAYNKVVALVKSAQGHGINKRDSAATHGMGTVLDSPYKNGVRLYSRHFGYPHEKRINDGLQSRSSSATLESIFAQCSVRLNKACGGNARDSEDALPDCSWEKEMKDFILSFP